MVHIRFGNEPFEFPTDITWGPLSDRNLALLPFDNKVFMRVLSMVHFTSSEFIEVHPIMNKTAVIVQNG